MAEYKLQALRTFEGNEGIVRRGDIFKVENKERFDQLQRLELAAEADKDAEITHFAQMKAELAKKKKDELQEVAAAENVDIPEGATKEQINDKILTKRETDYLTGKAQTKGSEGLAGTIAGSGASGGVAAGGTTGATGATTGGATGATGTAAAGGTGATGGTGGAGV